MDCSLPGSSIHGIFQARVLEWGAIAFSEPKNSKETEVWTVLTHSLQRKATMILKHNINIEGEGNGTPLHYSCLENPMDGGAWKAAVHGVAKSRA